MVPVAVAERAKRAKRAKRADMNRCRYDKKCKRRNCAYIHSNYTVRSMSHSSIICVDTRSQCTDPGCVFNHRIDPLKRDRSNTVDMSGGASNANRTAGGASNAGGVDRTGDNTNQGVSRDEWNEVIEENKRLRQTLLNERTVLQIHRARSEHMQDLKNRNKELGNELQTMKHHNDALQRMKTDMFLAAMKLRCELESVQRIRSEINKTN